MSPLKAFPAALFAIASGVLYWAAFPGIDVWPFAFICWAPLLIALRGQRPKRALWLGLLQGLTCNVLGFYWLLGMLRTFSGFPTALCAFFMLILCAYQGGRMAMMSWLYARAERRGWPAGLVFVLALIASEIAYPLLFPWYTGAQTHTVPVLMQLADLGGPILIGVALAGGSIALAEAGWARLEKRPIDRRRLAIGIAGPILLILYGLIRVPMVDKAIAAAPKARVGVVQGNLGLGPSEHRDSAALHRAATARLEKEGPPLDLVVWSETALNFSIPEEYLSPILKRTVYTGFAGITPEHHTPILTGVIVRRGGVERKKGKLYNSAVIVEPSGKVDGVYDKTYLLAFGEYIPFGDWFPKLYEMSPNSGNLTKGSSLAPIPFGEHRITTLICYEDILPYFTNDAVRHGDPDLLVNVTNDAWFGKSTEPVIHLALAKFRAVEHRRFLVRATNSGVSAFVDPVGRSTGETPIYEEAVRSGEVRWMRSRTGYEIWGDIPWWLGAMLVALMGIVRRSPDGKMKLEI
jgi:apolipoprotein N-acyltransferase